jgi:hypothetical protein
MIKRRLSIYLEPSLIWHTGGEAISTILDHQNMATQEIL